MGLPEKAITPAVGRSRDGSGVFDAYRAALFDRVNTAITDR